VTTCIAFGNEQPNQNRHGDKRAARGHEGSDCPRNRNSLVILLRLELVIGIFHRPAKNQEDSQ
jgi:hypothetical protein